MDLGKEAEAEKEVEKESKVGRANLKMEGHLLQFLNQKFFQKELRSERTGKGKKDWPQSGTPVKKRKSTEDGQEYYGVAWQSGKGSYYQDWTSFSPSYFTSNEDNAWYQKPGRNYNKSAHWEGDHEEQEEHQDYEEYAEEHGQQAW